MRTALLLLACVSLLVIVPAGAKAPPIPRQTAVVGTGAAPCGLAARAGSVWVGVYRTGMLLRLDDRRGREEARVRVGSFACRVAVGPRAVWATRDRAGEVVRLSLGSGERRRVPVGAGAFDVVLAHGSAWATSFDHGTVTRIDAATGRVARVLEVGERPAGLVACGGRVWIGHGVGRVVTSIDPTSGDQRRVVVPAQSPGWPHCIGGVLWVTTPDTVVRLDPASGKVLSHLRLGETLADAAAGPDGLVWVSDKEHALVHRLTPDGRRRVDAFTAGPGAFALARAGRAMWVTSFAGSDVRRFAP